MGTRIRTGCNVDRTDALVLQQLPDAENVIAIADRDTTAQPVSPHDDADPHGGLRGVAGLHFRDQAALRHSVAHEVVATDTAFAEGRIIGGTSCRNDDWRQSTMKEIK